MVTVTRTDEYAAWFRKLRDARAKAKILTRIDRLLDGNAGDVAPIGDGLSELRITARDTEFISPIAGPR
jgi:putative addiction module killer protein